MVADESPIWRTVCLFPRQWRSIREKEQSYDSIREEREREREREQYRSSMLQCIFLLSDSGWVISSMTQSIWKITTLIIFVRFCVHREVMLEKQLTGHRVDRSICAWFWDQADSFKVLLSHTFLFQSFFAIDPTLCFCLDSHFQWLLHQRITFFKSFVMASPF